MVRTSTKKIKIKDEGVTIVEDADSLDFAGPTSSTVNVGKEVTQTSSAAPFLWEKPGGGATFTYDANGNIITKTMGAVVLTFTYTASGNINTISDGTNVKTFTYNAGGDLTGVSYT